MTALTYQKDARAYRFSLPNEIWGLKLPPPAFSILAYLCYLNSHHRGGAVPSVDEIAALFHMSPDMAEKQLDTLVKRNLISPQMVPVFSRKHTGKFFSLPKEIFSGPGARRDHRLCLPALLRRPQQPSMPSQLQPHLRHCGAGRKHGDETHRQTGGQAVYHSRAHQLFRPPGNEVERQQLLHHSADPGSRRPFLRAADGETGGSHGASAGSRGTAKTRPCSPL